MHEKERRKVLKNPNHELSDEKAEEVIGGCVIKDRTIPEKCFYCGGIIRNNKCCQCGKSDTI